MQTEIASKRRRLAEIVAGLGPDATPARIREEAYRAGFGVVNKHMLLLVRNKLWPGREKRTGGMRLDGQPKTWNSSGCQTSPCPECESTRTSVTGGYRRKGRPGTYVRERRCSQCGHRWKREEEDVRLPGRYTNKIQWSLLTEKECTYCKRTLPIEAFGLQAGSDVIRRPGCKECLANKRAEYIGRDLVKKYGITIDDYRAMLKRQGGRCAICGTENPFGRVDGIGRKRKRRTFSVDHCHSTGKVRGLLCARCNIALGNFDDDPNLLRGAVEYLERNRREEEGVM